MTTEHRPLFWSTWSSVEREAFTELTEREARTTALSEQLKPQVSAAAWDVCIELDTLANESEIFRLELIMARLRRLRPDLSDLLDWCFDVDGGWHSVDAAHLVDRVVPGALR